MKKLFYSEDRDCCTYPKGNRFESVKVSVSDNGDIWMEGKGYLGCMKRVKLTNGQATYIKKLYEISQEFEKDGK